MGCQCGKRVAPEPRGETYQAPPELLQDPDPLPGKEKHLPLPLLRDIDLPDAGGGQRLCAQVCCYSHLRGLRGVTFAVRAPSGAVTVRQYTDAALADWRELNGIDMPWPSFFKALKGALTKPGDGVRIPDDTAAAETWCPSIEILLHTKEKGEPRPLVCPLELPRGGQEAATFTHFLQPFLDHHRARKRVTPAPDPDEEGGKKVRGLREEEAVPLEAQLNFHEARATEAGRCIASSQQLLPTLRQEAKTLLQASNETQSRLDRVAKRIERLQGGGDVVHPLDGLYGEGGARPFRHVPCAAHHVPRAADPMDDVVRLLEDGRMQRVHESPDPAGALALLAGAPSDPEVRKLVEAHGSGRALKIMAAMQQLDSWDYDCFSVDELTSGHCLTYTSYALLLRHGIIGALGLDRTIVMNFLSAAQAGYCPNAYHNQVHAADVLQITHYVIATGGMTRLCHLTKVDQLAAVLAAAIHDYNHPGFNNNFHSRVGTYLGTLYNDRSILENHHCATVFEMMRHGKYNILQPLTHDHQKDARDTMVEMLLSTDMGNHAKIFSQFRRRLAESPDWFSRKDDVRLALVMAIKLADVSNCARPKRLYLEWADRIAREFYVQGDTELEMKLSVSPFMDRRKHKNDFPKGQVSFMNYIVIPLFEAMSEFLPELDFCTQLCQENKEYWQGMEGEL